jgi:hypothetical protein
VVALTLLLLLPIELTVAVSAIVTSDLNNAFANTAAAATVVHLLLLLLRWLPVFVVFLLLGAAGAGLDGRRGLDDDDGRWRAKRAPCRRLLLLRAPPALLLQRFGLLLKKN